MIFETLNTYVDFVEDIDFKDILDIYNSNKEFLKAHMDKEKVDIKWLEFEINEMKKIGFYSCKIKDKNTLETVGLLDFGMKEECYLSLLMIHNEYKNKGYGKEVYKGLEEYLNDKVSSIRIDVVTDYNKDVLKFWKLNGFEVKDEIKLNWAGKDLPAVLMKKYLIL
ncbi:GNAT family N-acetyltransferase [Tepidibacter formicigenes]|jgi:ribosomal protein S18 acetylase RimI-like enzyme|uniref:Acetyltransferase (GNAT) domain-containing protein n=1 Tax=Tepidibacter formicigenes DSM 15518 TaxID=1123349 RepID=A0A1M6QP74_9FIRM|nr:GNAT family N-acetyltransferase [Tepidibacter formicigenes]SHK21883.1 Acetyltransferase (GNAT) domain-containing protein [Tepidibacter formicigenes DSM 15518]